MMRGMRRIFPQNKTLVKKRHITYNVYSLKCTITSVSFEPTFTLNGIPISPCGCQAFTLMRIAEEDKSPVAVTHLARARSQRTGGGISGAIFPDEE